MSAKTLPVPPLDDTLSRFLTAAEPLVDRETLEDTRREVERFASQEGCLLYTSPSPRDRG